MTRRRYTQEHLWCAVLKDTKKARLIAADSHEEAKRRAMDELRCTNWRRVRLRRASELEYYEYIDFYLGEDKLQDSEIVSMLVWCIFRRVVA